MADEEQSEEEEPQPQAPKKNSNTWMLIVMVIVGFIAAIIFIAGFAMFGDRTGVGSDLPMIGTGGGGTGGGGGGGGAGDCTWEDVSKDSPGTNIVSVTVPIWKYAGSGQKTAGNMTLRVHANCAGSIKNLFNTIYNSSDKPPIQTSDTGCYAARSRSTSRHNWGVACDVNWNENWCFNCYGASGSHVGNFWKPGDIEPDKTYTGWVSGYDVRSIPINGTIASAFFSENWGRGLYRSFNDFMHFSVDGH